MRASSRIAAFAALALALAALLTGCGGGSKSNDKGLDAADVEEALEAEQRLTSPDLKVGEANCPDDVDVVQGATLRCELTIEGVEAPYLVRVQRGTAGRPRLEFVNARPIIDVSRLVEFVSGELGTSARVDCGTAKVKVVSVGTRLRCTAGGKPVTVVVKDRIGNVALAGR